MKKQPDRASSLPSRAPAARPEIFLSGWIERFPEVPIFSGRAGPLWQHGVAMSDRIERARVAGRIATCGETAFDFTRTRHHATGIFLIPPEDVPPGCRARRCDCSEQPIMSAQHKRRLERQIAALTSRSPRLRGLAARIQGRPGVLVRLPLGLVLIAGGFLAILPVFGLWMIPLGLLLLAIDLPMLRPSVSAAIIRLRRKWSTWRRKFRNRD